ncbi:MAG: hypothetical protein FWF60_01335 [Oscillospiraceae bacterium]|nr:hypothetical protein [Oscillospiraceae bacterium]
MGALNSLRVPYLLAEDEPQFRALLELLRARREMNLQITLFMAVSHPPMPLEMAKVQAEVLRERMETARAYGFASGINILSTLGHHEENLDNSLRGDYTPMTNIRGQVCRGSFCPNDENLRGHIRALYRLIVGARPDYIWIDDDVRFGHMPIGEGCFCENCLRIFEEEFGVKYSPERRLEWLQHNRNTLNRLFRLIEETVRECESGPIPLGFMTGERFYEGYAFDEIADILRGEAGREVWWRPGGGAYTDERLYDLIEKSHQIGRQVSLLPPYVKVIQSEIENFPYQMLKKSPAATALEAASHIAAGCTGSAYNVIPALTGEPPADFAPMFDRLKETQPFYDLLAGTFGRTPPVGVWPGWTRDLWAVRGDPGNYAKELWELGLPAAYAPENACATLLSGSSVKAMPAELIQKILSGGVYMDASALDHLNEMGYGELTGFALKEYLDKDCIEVFDGLQRNCYQAFTRGDAAVIAPTNPSCEILSRMQDYSGNILSACSWGTFENARGGRVCVAGYYPWSYIQSRPKLRQIVRLFRWLSGDTLPSLPGSYCRLHNWTRRLEHGGIAAALINASLDTLLNTEILLQTEAKNCVAYDMRCEKMDCRFLGRREGYNAFSIPVIRPWQMVLVIAEGENSNA